MASDVINQVKDAEIAADKLVDDAKKKAKEIIESSKIEASNSYKEKIEKAKKDASDLIENAKKEASEEKIPLIDKAKDESKDILAQDEGKIEGLLNLLTERIVNNGNS